MFAKHHRIFVFIHGTFQAGCTLFNLRQAIQDNFNEHTWYERTLKLSRMQGFTEKSDLMLGLGLIDITQEVTCLCLETSMRHKAAIHIVRAFHLLNLQSNFTSIPHYYTFGWSGLLSEKHRESSARELYDALKKIHQFYTNKGDTISFEIHTHSHGAQLALYLGAIWKNRSDNNFSIDTLILSAAPLYYQKTCYAYSGLFKHVINIYSHGDMIQTLDCISTPENRCFRTLQETGPIPSGNTESPFIADLVIGAYGDTSIFGHGSFFILNRYHIPHMRLEHRKIKGLLKNLDPLPLISFYPAFIPELINFMKKDDSYGYHQGVIDLQCDHKEITMTMTHYYPRRRIQDRIQLTIPAAYTTIQQEVIDAYHPIGYYSEFNKTIDGIKNACSTLANKKKLGRKRRLAAKRARA